MTVPVVYSVCHAFPETRFVMLTQKFTTSLFVNAPANLTVVGVDLKAPECHGVAGLWHLAAKMVADYAIDAYADLHDVLRSRLIGLYCSLHRIPVFRIDKGRGEKRRLIHHGDKPLSHLRTTHERYAEVLRRMGFEFDCRFTSVYTDGADASVYADITTPKKAEEQWIGIAPFAKHKGKIYPFERMREVVALLLQKGNRRIFLFGGGAEEQQLLRSLANTAPDSIVSLAEKRHGFAKEMALMSDMDVMVSMDSANMHIASLVGLPVVSVWGQTHPFCGFTGWQQAENNEVQLDLPCRPCSVFGNKECHLATPYACMTGIRPEMVAERVEKVLDNKK